MDISLPGGIWSLSPLAALVGVIVLLFWMLATGKILTRSQHTEITESAKTRGDEWKQTALEYRSTIRDLEARSVVLPSPEAANALRGVKAE